VLDHLSSSLFENNVVRENINQLSMLPPQSPRNGDTIFYTAGASPSCFTVI